MANKFTKSVLERQAKEYKRDTRVSAPSESPEPPPAKPAAVTEETAAASAETESRGASGAQAEAVSPADVAAPIAQPANREASEGTAVSLSPVPQGTSTPEPPVVASPAANAAPPAGKRRGAPLDLDAYLVRDEGRSAKNKTFYLDDAVIDGLHSAAAARGIPDSKLVNDILRKVLGL